MKLSPKGTTKKQRQKDTIYYYSKRGRKTQWEAEAVNEKNRNISRLEGAVLLLTVLFAVCTLLWFRVNQPSAGMTLVESSHAVRSTETAETPEAPGMLENEQLDLNTASPADLTRLPGIGEKKAAAIVAYRAENGGFTSPEELTEVDGIGEGTYEALAPYVTVGGAEEGDGNGTDTGG